jgi:tRNA/tmRNA/rRNA uracil-C5-methylase (TrmA/RlmC/RlmD family)
VSCGRHALVRDLGLLGDCFEVSNILLTDLFPRTDSVETLVHLKRKGTVT